MMIEKMDHASLSIRSAEHEEDPWSMEASNESAWERGLDCINSILKPGSKTLAALSEEQQVGLKDLKAMMISAAVNGNAKNHIPQALLDSKDDTNSSYLLAEYAGIQRRSAALTSMTKVFAAQKVALKFKKIALKTLKAQSTGSSEFVTLKNMPEYWHELDKHAKIKLRDLLSWDNICRWDFNIFDVDEVLKGKNTLVFVAWAIIASPNSQYAMEMSCNEFSGRSSNKHIEGLKTRRGYNFMNQLKIREKTLINFLRAIEERYNSDVSYHNHVHAADVTQSLHVLLQMGAKNFTEEKLELFSMLIAAVVHDVGHNGLNNSFHVNSRSELALLYNDVSVLENMHASSAFRLILGDNRDRTLDIFENFDEDQTTKARDFITKAVLSTDMKKHFSSLNAIKGILMGVDDVGMMLSTELPTDLCLRTEILTFIIHLSDISNPSKETSLATKWTDRLLEEAFKQGDLEESMGLPFSPLCDRSTTNREKSQIGFINFVVLPSYELLGKLIPRVENEVVPILHENLKYWKEHDELINGSPKSPKPPKPKRATILSTTLSTTLSGAFTKRK
uniref:Phosphodiesterase n=1 Tax=Pseudo-nitzschia delicatissima TaxID=44447 RepID=A0A7S0XLP4_9STRA|mmetsp:Transcript_607/g.1372  ORF Transcript_607/g.1372 Transcript_607/m.1372 type:complete len:563 (+) Transcript_607:187-1875(+)|eukprot:CAMPEP_0116102076 /NCGR_PEP_ID=MMETSP0327-20121206/13152_1 /TAXON_ID=44447 /ORGANISM="Pseudo-nitzschia delicatissima, Strain B596" /LENGTH=562 /DNA_ID=CAMNT_0003594083 /DNA_START=113 /DNA_END=1801 /DNA_ORIENTATION=+